MHVYVFRSVLLSVQFAMPVLLYIYYHFISNNYTYCLPLST